MMKTRQEIKQQAKTNMGKQRATAVSIILLPLALGIIIGLLAMIPIIGELTAIAGILAALVLAVGVNGAYISIYNDGPAAAAAVIGSCKVNFWRKAGGMLWMALLVFLWSLLLIVPGIVKAYAYSMTPYILADCPEVTADRALELSMRMTKGHKGKLFIMHWSFIGWMLLSALTLYILLIVHVAPYIQATMAGYYEELRKEALSKGIIKPEEFGAYNY